MKRTLLLLSLVACTTKTADVPVSTKKADAVEKEETTVQIALGSGSRQPRLPFTITKTYDAPPVKVDGDGWTFYDAKLKDGTPFTFGMHLGKPMKDFPMSFGKGILILSDNQSGEKFVSAFAEAFRVPARAKATTQKAPQPLRFATAVLGRGVNRHEGGGFGGRGSWIATKLFPAHGGVQGEVFFNYDPASKTGEFAEKDSGYNKDVADVFAAVLRDGA